MSDCVCRYLFAFGKARVTSWRRRETGISCRRMRGGGWSLNEHAILLRRYGMDTVLQKPWVRCYEPGVPEMVEIPKHTLPESLTMAADKYPDDTAIFFFDNKMTYRQLDTAATRFAAGLQSLGVKKGDRVMLFLPNSPQFVIAFYGI